MKIVVYTAVFGGYDALLPPGMKVEASSDDLRYVCLTDEPQQVPGWEYETPRIYTSDLRKESRRAKILAHKYFPDADISIWHGGSFTLNVSPFEALSWLPPDKDVATLRHPHRDCVYDEAKAVLMLGKGDRRKVERQMSIYESKGYPRHKGLAATTLMVRRHTKQMEELNELWWKWVRDNSVRDQLAFPYVSWELGVEWATIPGDLTRDPKWTWRPHG